MGACRIFVGYRVQCCEFLVEPNVNWEIVIPRDETINGSVSEITIQRRSFELNKWRWYCDREYLYYFFNALASIFSLKIKWKSRTMARVGSSQHS